MKPVPPFHASGPVRVPVIALAWLAAASLSAATWPARATDAPPPAVPAADAANATDTRQAEPSPWREATVVVGAEDWALPGILTRPAAGPARASVVLVHGSGPHDADQTIFGNKPFRDLAHGLARHGIASLRYVKRSREHGARLAAQADTLTVREEVIDDAVAAVAFLQSPDGVPAAPVFLLGHSLGGFLAPRIARETRGLSGLVVMAGNARPLEDLVLEQVRMLAPAQGVSEAQIAAMESQRQNVKALSRGEPVDGPLLLNLPAAYWRDLSRYDPVATAQQVGLPMLIVQGERDYQVTMTDFAAWRDGLAQRPQVQFRSYPRLNHLFVAGEGASTPLEYLTPARVDQAFIDDVAGWILETARTARP
jgi:dienelactone hydrolase